MSRFRESGAGSSGREERRSEELSHWGGVRDLAHVVQLMREVAFYLMAVDDADLERDFEVLHGRVERMYLRAMRAYRTKLSRGSGEGH